MTNRRSFLKNASLVAAAGVCATGSNSLSAAPSSTSRNKSFGLQTYSLGGELGADVPGGLKRVAAMGYSYIELAGYNRQGRIGNVPMAEFKKFADDAGLEIRSTHTNPQPGINGPYTRENFDQIMEFWKIACDHHAAIGCRYIIQPGDPTINNTEDLAMTCEVFNEAGRIANAAGLVFGFHNHANEFRRVVPGGTERLGFGQTGATRGQQPPEGIKMVYDGMIEGTDPSLVRFELDVYWCVYGLQCPVEYMRRYPNRIRLLHIKDRQILGESGWMNFQKIFETGYSNGIDNYIVELEGYRVGTQFEGVKGCADYLLNARFVR